MAKRYTMNGFICPLDDEGYPQTVVPYGGVIYLPADYDALAAELAEAKSVNAAIGYAESQNNARMLAAEACIRELEAELNEQARVNGMGGSREAALLAKVARLKAALREAMEWNWIEDASLDGGIPESVVKQCNDALGASELETKGEQR